MYGRPSHVAAGVREGDVIAGKYRVDKILGAGGMGIVVAARHIQLDEKVALKFLLPEAVGNPDAVGRFVREARAAVKIKSEHVARVTDVGTLDNGSPYLVMEYLDGSDLSAWLKQRGAMPVEQAVDFVLQACQALAEAHALGIVHRDLKPANLFCILRADGQLSIKLLDFGISKVTTPGTQGHDVTRTGALMGSPLYMSPEQMQMSKGVDARTDIWSLGVILFELMTGRPPFVADAVTELAIMVASEPAPALRVFCPQAPAGLERVVARCLEKSRANRFQTVGELALALKDFGSRAARISVERVLGTLRKARLSEAELPASGAHPLSTVPAAAAITDANTTASWGQTGAGTRAKSPGKVVVATSAAALLVALGVGGVLIWRRATTTPAPPAPSAATAVIPAPILSPSSVQVQPEPRGTSAPPVLAIASLPPVESPTPSPPLHPTMLPRPTGNTAMPSPRPAPSAAPAIQPNCDPPYYVNAKGSRIFKKECL
jgi:serine/threonine protein kinase